MDIVKTATGKEFKSDYLATITTPAQVYMRILDTPPATIAAVFSDREEVVRIRYGENYLEGYTRLVAIVIETGAVKVILAKE